jgi:hypothetical protein
MSKSAIAFAESDSELRVLFEASREVWYASTGLSVFSGLQEAIQHGGPMKLRLQDSRLRRILLRAELAGVARRGDRLATSDAIGQ